MKKLIPFSGLFLGLVFITGCRTPTREKQIYAHYMGCYPAGRSATHYHMNEAHKVRHTSSNISEAIGGHIVNFSLTPQDRELSKDESARLEISRALRGGIDGFAVDAWAGGENAKQTLDSLFAAAEAMKAPFYLTICLDPACQPPNPQEPHNHIENFANSIKWLLDRHGNSPNLARRNGRPLIFGYFSNGILDHTEAYRKTAEGPARWQMIRDGYDQIEKMVGQPLYFHYDFDYGIPKTPEHAQWVSRHFDAVGGFLGTNDRWRFNKDLIAAIKQGGAEWSMPMWFQYNNKSGSLCAEKGTDILWQNWAWARETDSSLIQFVTWNDYTEETVLGPGYATNYTILNLNRYFIDWWKLGRRPDVDQDQVHLIFRKNMPGTATYPFRERRTAPGVLEVTTLLRSPGKIEVDRFGSYDAPAGYYRKQFPLSPGKVSARLFRDSATEPVVSVSAPEQITGKPFREDNVMACFSSNYDEQWKLDFPNDPPLYYSEYGDADNDGLPNWFEMYWFGRFPLMSTATQAAAGADPDGDGANNLTEWSQQSNPLDAKKKYAPGFIWNMEHIHQRGLSFNPDNDRNGSPVWTYRYKHGKVGNIPRDGEYPLDTSSHPNVPYAGLMAHFSPQEDPDLPENGYGSVYGWISRNNDAEGKVMLRFVPRKMAAQILAWRSPVKGKVRLECSGTVAPGPVRCSIEILKGQQSLFKKNSERDMGELAFGLQKEVDVQIGDQLYFIADCNENTAVVEVNTLQITLMELNEE